jgi:hypothetical protein
MSALQQFFANRAQFPNSMHNSPPHDLLLLAAASPVVKRELSEPLTT